MNVQTMLADSARIEDLSDENEKTDTNREIHSKEDIEKYITSLM